MGRGERSSSSLLERLKGWEAGLDARPWRGLLGPMMGGRWFGVPIP